MHLYTGQPRLRSSLLSLSRSYTGEAQVAGSMIVPFAVGSSVLKQAQTHDVGSKFQISSRIVLQRLLTRLTQISLDMSDQAKNVSVLMVCLGNICRSPMAEAVLNHRIAERTDLEGFRFDVDSAGTGAYHAGDGADER